MDLGWYETLNKPFFTPPSWLFAPAWTILYILIGISGFLIFRKGMKKKNVKRAMGFFLLQLGLNFFWSPVFFGAHQILLSLVIIVFLWYFIYKTIKLFAEIDKRASYLLYPYLVWVSFATLLNLSFFILNSK
ncbi:MAG TPA: TspO/MBR family protein [Candidatus Saccharimonadales bacterium]|nr:TspO/MBR family protein [Candidatus Saccharimonadales bacterium]